MFEFMAMSGYVPMYVCMYVCMAMYGYVSMNERTRNECCFVTF